MTLSSQSARDAVLTSGICDRDRHLHLTSMDVPPMFVSIRVPFEVPNDRIINYRSTAEYINLLFEENIGLLILKRVIEPLKCMMYSNNI